MTSNELTLLGLIIGAFISLASGGIVLAYLFAQRITRLETVVEMMGVKSINALHSPTNHLGLDELIDTCKSKEYSLTYVEWQSLLEKLNHVLNTHKELTNGEKSLLIQSISFCRGKVLQHKGNRYQELVGA